MMLTSNARTGRARARRLGRRLELEQGDVEAAARRLHSPGDPQQFAIARGRLRECQGNPNVKALVYVNGQALDEGETPFDVVGPDSALAVPDPTTVFDFVPATLPPTATTDLYLKRSAVFDSFAPGLSAREKDLVYATQRPAAFGGLTEPSGVPAWRTIPSWYLIGTKDKIIPYSAQHFMAERAGSTITEYDAGHLGLMSDSRTVTRGIERTVKASCRVH